MSTTVAEMTLDELHELIEGVVEQKLIELFGDPDGGQELSPTLRARLQDQLQAVARGDRGISLTAVAADLGLD